MLPVDVLSLQRRNRIQADELRGAISVNIRGCGAAKGNARAASTPTLPRFAGEGAKIRLDRPTHARRHCPDPSQAGLVPPMDAAALVLLGPPTLRTAARSEPFPA